MNKIPIKGLKDKILTANEVKQSYKYYGNGARSILIVFFATMTTSILVTLPTH